jgi:hypothetical protein
VEAALTKARAFETTWETHYTAAFTRYEDFVGRLSEIVAIGAENGTDGAFDGIYAAMRTSSPPPKERVRARYLWPEGVDVELRADLHGLITAEYRNSHPFEHLHEDHYEGELSFDDFVDHVAGLVVTGGVNGADDALASIYRALLNGSPLPSARRRPRRLR